MTQADFLLLIQCELALIGAAYDRAELLAWTGYMWPWNIEKPDAHLWARDFAEITRTEVRKLCGSGAEREIIERPSGQRKS